MERTLVNQQEGENWPKASPSFYYCVMDAANHLPKLTHTTQEIYPSLLSMNQALNGEDFGHIVLEREGAWDIYFGRNSWLLEGDWKSDCKPM